MVKKDVPHDDFFLATLIEFTQWSDGKEKTIAKFNSFYDLPSHLINHFKTDSDSALFLEEKQWKILEINKDLRSHGNGMHLKVRLEAK